MQAREPRAIRGRPARHWAQALGGRTPTSFTTARRPKAARVRARPRGCWRGEAWLPGGPVAAGAPTHPGRPASCVRGVARRRACERGAVGWRVLAEPTIMLRLNSQFVGFSPPTGLAPPRRASSKEGAAGALKLAPQTTNILPRQKPSDSKQMQMRRPHLIQNTESTTIKATTRAGEPAQREQSNATLNHCRWAARRESYQGPHASCLMHQ